MSDMTEAVEIRVSSNGRPRSTRFLWTAFAASAILCLVLPAFSQDEVSEQWKAQLEERRARAAQSAPPPTASESASPAADEKRGIVINGKVISSKRKNFAVPSGASNPSATTPAALAPPSVAAATPSAPQPPAPQPTPALVKIKKTQIIGGKILTVEIEVTPTPSPVGAPEAAPAAASVASATAAVGSATGYMREVMEKLQIAENSPTGSMRFESKMIAKLREEFMMAKNRPNFAEIVPTTRALQIQSHLQRLSSVARGGNIDTDTAKILLKVLFPPEADKAQQVQVGAAPGAAAAPPNPSVPGGTGATPEAVESPPEPPPVEQPQLYLDAYGRYVYEDGTPVLDENGQEIYYVEPQGYYDENGVFHEATSTY